jgi:hypothetical protein
MCHIVKNVDIAVTVKGFNILLDTALLGQTIGQSEIREERSSGTG